jgi:hypothetical protein
MGWRDEIERSAIFYVDVFVAVEAPNLHRDQQAKRYVCDAFNINHLGATEFNRVQ